MMGNGDVLTQAVAALARGALVVAAHERAATVLRRRYDRMQRDQGRSLWEAPAVRSWAAWRRELWQELLLEGCAEQLLLSTEQELSLWRMIIRKDASPAASPAATDRLAEAARAAWRGLCSFAGQELLRSGPAAGWAPRDASPRQDSETFARWAAEFIRRGRSDQLLSEPELDQMLCQMLDRKRLRPAWRELLLVGFTDEWTPLQLRLMEALRRAGLTVNEAAEGAAMNAHLIRAEDDDTELRACARWCREQLAHGRSAAIVLSDQTRAQALGRTLRDTLQPGDGDTPASREVEPLYSFSHAGTAAEQPMIAVALDILRLTTGALPLERVSLLLRSRYFASFADQVEEQSCERTPLLWAGEDLVETPEWAARAHFDAFELRAHGRLRPELTVAALAREVRTSRGVSRLRRLLGVLEALRREGTALTGDQRGYGVWAEKLRALLRVAGWHPKHDGGVPVEAQLERAWDSLLDTLATLDFSSPRVTIDEALDRLVRMAQKRPFTPSHTSAPIEVIGPHEFVAGEFEAVWYLGVGEATWPTAGALLPLLPWHLQRDLGMPGTDRVRDQQQAVSSWTRRAASAPEVVFSYAAQVAEVGQRATPALRALQLREVSVTEVATPRQVLALETVRAAGGLPALPDRVLRGGARVLEAQAACGFRAFAEHRLWSTGIDDVGLGLDSAQRGTLVHRALEQIWKRIDGREQLRAMSSTERRHLLTDAVEHSIGGAPWPGEATWENAYMGLERKRLYRLLDHWLDVEAARPEFTVHLQERALEDVAIGPLRLSVRIDRVDLVEDRRVLIDYKTGQAATQSWRGERPDAPQLPLYAVLTQDHGIGRPDESARRLGAIAFATVHAGRDAKLRGFAETGGLLPHWDTKMDAADFEQQMDRWRAVLKTLAEEFASGTADVRPKRYPGTCAHCGQRMLCRLDVNSLEETAEEVDQETWEADPG